MNLLIPTAFGKIVSQLNRLVAGSRPARQYLAFTLDGSHGSELPSFIGPFSPDNTCNAWLNSTLDARGPFTPKGKFLWDQAFLLIGTHHSRFVYGFSQ